MCSSKRYGNEHYLHLLMSRNTHAGRIAVLFFKSLPNDSAYWLCRCGVNPRRRTARFKNYFARAHSSLRLRGSPWLRKENDPSPAGSLFQHFYVRCILFLVLPCDQWAASAPVYWEPRVAPTFEAPAYFFLNILSSPTHTVAVAGEKHRWSASKQIWVWVLWVGCACSAPSQNNLVLTRGQERWFFIAHTRVLAVWRQ